MEGPEEEGDQSIAHKKKFTSFQATTLIAYQTLSLSGAAIRGSSSATVAPIPLVPFSPLPHLENEFLPSVSSLHPRSLTLSGLMTCDHFIWRAARTVSRRNVNASVNTWWDLSLRFHMCFIWRKDDNERGGRRSFFGAHKTLSLLEVNWWLTLTTTRLIMMLRSSFGSTFKHINDAILLPTPNKTDGWFLFKRVIPDKQRLWGTSAAEE